MEVLMAPGSFAAARSENEEQDSHPRSGSARPKRSQTKLLAPDSG